MKNLGYDLVVALILVPAISFAQRPSTGEVSGSAGDHPGGAPEALLSTWRGTHISRQVAQRLLIKRVHPQYPKDAWQRRIEGQVFLRAVVDKNGDVESLSLVEGHPLLAPAAIEAVKQWKYKPYLLNGQPVKVETQIVVNFQLSGH